jgi:hypothetical protein
MVNQMVSSAQKTISNDPDLTQQFNNYLSGTGLSYDEYWKIATPIYKKALIIGQYKRSLETTFSQKNNITDQQQLETQFNAYCDNLTKQFRSEQNVKYLIQ